MNKLSFQKLLSDKKFVFFTHKREYFKILWDVFIWFKKKKFGQEKRNDALNAI